jgi:hypothetical protein
VKSAGAPSTYGAWRPRLRRGTAMVREILALYLRVRWLLVRRGLNAAAVDLREASVSAAHPRETKANQGPDELALASSRVLRFLPTDDRRIICSLVLTGLLARHGLDSTLVIGVDQGPEFAARVWVEHGGAPLIDPGPLHRLLEFK